MYRASCIKAVPASQQISGNILLSTQSLLKVILSPSSFHLVKQPNGFCILYVSCSLQFLFIMVDQGWDVVMPNSRVGICLHCSLSGAVSKNKKINAIFYAREDET